METTDREHIQRTFETWNRETLLDELVQRGDDFTPVARELLVAELTKRGVSEATIEHARETYRTNLAERHLPLESLRTVETFGDRLSATAAREVLAQSEIPAEVFGSDRLLFGPGLLGVGPRPVNLKVAEHDLERAKEALRDFAPTVEPSTIQKPEEAPDSEDR